MNRWLVSLTEDENGEMLLVLPDKLIETLGWKENDTLNWTNNNNGTWTLSLQEDDDEKIL